jgi:hypothetical protein
LSGNPKPFVVVVPVVLDLSGDPIPVVLDLSGDPIPVVLDLSGDPIPVVLGLSGDPVFSLCHCCSLLFQRLVDLSGDHHSLV